MEEIDDSDPLPPIAGNPVTVDSEHRRLAHLSVFLDETATAIKKAYAQNWEGRSGERFEELRDELVKRCRLAADSHSAAARALDRYSSTLDDLQKLRRAAVADLRANHSVEAAAAARAAITRWRRQLASAALTAATEINRAGDDLASVRQLLTEREVVVRAPVAEPERPVSPPKPAARRVSTAAALPGPHEGRKDLAAYQEKVRHVNDAVLRGWRLISRPTVLPSTG